MSRRQRRSRAPCHSGTAGFSNPGVRQSVLVKYCSRSASVVTKACFRLVQFLISARCCYLGSALLLMNLERISGRAQMANEHWYVLKVRSGFEVIAAQRLRQLNLEVFVPRKAVD